MCGRFYVDDETAREVEKAAGSMGRQMRTGDIRPSQSASVLVCKNKLQAAEDPRVFKLEEMHWGFPQYHKKGLLINARAETALERKMFCGSVRRRRCVIAAKHFYEWDRGRNKAAFFREDKPVVYMAGFYNRFEDEERFIILTTQANASVSPIHHRMPLVLEEKELEAWVYDDTFTEYALHKTPPMLGKEQEYEQQSLFLI